MNEVQEKLRAAQDLIRDPERWCQDAMAKWRFGIPAHPRGRMARRWCIAGAVVRVYSANDFCDTPALMPLARAASQLGYAGALHLNDNTDHATVMRCFDRAIELAGES